MIAFLTNSIGLECAFDDCYLHARYYFTMIFISMFCMNIWEIMKPKLMILTRFKRTH